ncbi:hypothetical protein BDK51DRAFT_52308 [Blyttiomyces helicus]|uniref:F-box domain-containing protein n=1 Tax=Blyttiomyces helicus TaxID=388810 RepID=A0A4P9WBT7_9FUNG|nr:hypothetical protein BDK51DRAFT_52308 [Blyttiomyces helicus]|eukprot:RKO90089.1 hypothetical protein BDK51DRAFT_52308 [Blyttiomyces helicus]
MPRIVVLDDDDQLPALEGGAPVPGEAPVDAALPRRSSDLQGTSPLSPAPPATSPDTPTLLLSSTPPPLTFPPPPPSHKLPIELLQKIFSNLDIRSKCRACRASRWWRAVMHACPRLWLRLDLSNRCSLGGEKWMSDRRRAVEPLLVMLLTPAIDVAPRFARLARIDLSCTSVDLAMFVYADIAGPLSTCLTSLVLNGCAGVTSGGLYHLRMLKALRALDLSHCEKIDDVGSGWESDSRDVVTIYSTGMEVHPRFASLSISQFTRRNSHLFPPERGISRLFRLPALTSVNLMGCYRLKTYPWATQEFEKKCGTLPIRELMLGEDSRIQTRGFWLLW